MKQLIIQTQQAETASVMRVNVYGKLVGMEAVQLRNRVNRMTDGRHMDLEINLSGLSAMDLKGVNSLAAIYRMQNSKGCEVTFLHQPGGPVMIAMQPTKLNRVLPLIEVTNSVAV